MLKILLVDDDCLVLNGLKQMLQWEKFHGELVGEAYNGEEALKMAIANEPDVIIADIRMPIMDGLEMTRCVKERLDTVQIIILSGLDDFEYAQKAIHYEVSEYILKPITRDKIKKLNQKLISLEEAKQSLKEVYLNILDNQTQDKVLLALQKCDILFFDNFFQSPLFSASHSTDCIVNVCLWLINCLYRFLEQFQSDNTILGESRQNLIDGFLALSGRQDKIDYIYQKYGDVIQCISQQKNDDTTSVMVFAKQYVDDNFLDANFNITMLADRMNISMSYLSITFRRAVGVNLSVYITGLRMDYAKKMLADPANSIADIADRIGYADAHYFSKLFKKQIGYTPSEYRNLLIQGIKPRTDE